MSAMKDAAIALEEFVNQFTDPYLARAVADQLTEQELGALANLLEAGGRPDSAQLWRDVHYSEGM